MSTSPTPTNNRPSGPGDPDGGWFANLFILPAKGYAWVRNLFKPKPPAKQGD